MRASGIILVLGAAALIGALIDGCERQGPTGATPASQPVAVNAPQTEPATQPAPLASLMVGNKQFWFPPALLRLTVVDGKVNARLTTDDPKEALDPNYQGNSFDLEMPDIADETVWEQTNQGSWSYESQSSAAQSDDSPHGIFLQGQAKRLYPKTARVDFSAQGSSVTVSVRGEFLMYDNATRGDQPFALPQMVMVQGSMVATVPAK